MIKGGGMDVHPPSSVDHDHVDGLVPATDLQLRRSSPFVSYSAALVAATVTRISPAAALDASRAVVLTTSPSAVKSSTAPFGPVVPTYASPVWMPAPIGYRSPLRRIGPPDPGTTRPPLQSPRSRGAVPYPSEEQPDDLIADQLVDEPVVAEDDLRARPVEPVEEASKSAGRMPSAIPVEPRTSAKRRLTGISAPVSPFLRKSLMQFEHIAGLPG